MFLTSDEVIALTGLHRPHAQAKYLSAHGYRFGRDVQGRVVLARAEVERHLVGGERKRKEPQLRMEAV